MYATNRSGLLFFPTSRQAEFDGAGMAPAIVADGTVIWCQKWNQGCFDVALYFEKTLIVGDRGI